MIILPVFIGPTMFHHDTYRYTRFFLAIREATGGEVSCAEMTDEVNLLLESDEERGDDGRIPVCFPARKSHTLCQIHGGLIDNAGVPVTDHNKVYIVIVCKWNSMINIIFALCLFASKSIFALMVYCLLFNYSTA